jgi:accessory gene regulator protein AgrB
MGTLIASAIVYGVLRDVFHGAHIVNGLYSVEVSVLMLLNAPLPSQVIRMTHCNYC